MRLDVRDRGKLALSLWRTKHEHYAVYLDGEPVYAIAADDDEGWADVLIENVNQPNLEQGVVGVHVERQHGVVYLKKLVPGGFDE